LFEFGLGSGTGGPWHRLLGEVDLLLGAGFDVDARGRADAPVEDEWQTALHAAAKEGNLGMAQRLLAAGADTGRRDRHYDSTPLGWARYFRHQRLVDLLEPLT
jgi:hypothetical protein